MSTLKADTVIAAQADTNLTLSATGTGTVRIVGDSGILQSVQTFTSTGTWTKPSGINAVVVEVRGGGGGGGAVPVTSGNFGSGGGGQCGFAKEFIDVTGRSSVTVTIGAGGASASAGATSSFGSFCSATGGGAGDNAGTTADVPCPGGLGGTASGGDLNLAGSPGGVSSIQSHNRGGEGGGDGGADGPNAGNSVGAAAVANTGGGGSGANNNNTTAYAGGAGGSGYVVVWEYG